MVKECEREESERASERENECGRYGECSSSVIEGRRGERVRGGERSSVVYDGDDVVVRHLFRYARLRRRRRRRRR